MTRKLQTILLLTVCLSILFASGMSVPAFGEQTSSGTVVKMPYPLKSQDIELLEQRVRITVYSNFIQVDSEYLVKNDSPDDITAQFGFPVHAHSLHMEKGESIPIDFKVLTGKKNEDLFVKKQVEGVIDTENDTAYKTWYSWDMDIKGEKTTRFKVQYYLKLQRDGGIPRIRYELSCLKDYLGEAKVSEVIVDLPMDAESLPIVHEKSPSMDKFLYCSLGKPLVRKNILTWDFAKQSTSKDLELAFYANGYPDWEISVSEEKYDKEKGDNLLDGNILTHWRGLVENMGMNVEFLLKPVIRTKDGRGKLFTPKVSRIGIIPGNSQSLSSFYSFSHLREGEVEVKKAAQETEPERSADGKRQKRSQKPAKPRREDRKDFLFLDCNADWTLQVFSTKSPLDTAGGPIRFVPVTVYQGQKNKELCISEILIFDRVPGELISW